MHKPKIEPLHTLILRADDIVLLLLLGQSIPLPLPDFVAPDIERFYKVEQHDVEATDAQQNLVAAAVQWLIVITVDVRRDDVARLYEHVVKCCRHCARANRVRVLRVPADQDRMAVWVA